MSIFSSLKKRYEQITPKQFIFTGVFMLALAGAIVGGFASKQMSSAQVYGGRDPDAVNSIDNSNNGGGVGALSADEFISDVNNNQPTDLQTIYDSFGLQKSEYTRFKSSYRPGIAYMDGTVVVDGEVVMKDAWSIGRTKFWYSKGYDINGHTYYKSDDKQVLQSDLPVMVMFDENGSVEFAVMNACGNPVGGEKIPSTATCNAIQKTPVQDKENTYDFTTDASVTGLAKIVQYDYYYNEGNGDIHFATTTSGSEVAEKQFTKSATVTVKVTISLPGKQTKVITSTLCSTHVGVVEHAVLYTCDALVATAIDNTSRKFRFTANTSQSAGVTVDSADFTLDGQITTKGVTDKDTSGNIYKDYEFTDNNGHTVSAIVHFTADGKAVTSEEGACVAKVTPQCKPGIPVGDTRCHEMPKTGATGVVGLFTGVSAAGAAAHRMFMSRRRRS